MVVRDSLKPSRGRYVWRLILTVLITAAAMSLSRVQGLIVSTEEVLSPIWIASGVNVGLMLVWGRRIWPGVLLASIIHNVIIAVNDPGTSWLLAMVAPPIDAIEPVVIVSLMRWCIGDEPLTFRRIPAVWFFLGASVLGTGFAAGLGTLGFAAFDLLQGYSASQTWVIWFVGNLIGTLVIVPVIWAWRGGEPEITRQRMLHAGAIGLTLAIVTIYVFLMTPGGGRSGAWLRVEPLLFLTIPVIVWAAVALGCYAAALTVLFTTMIAVIGTTMGRGPFMRLERDAALLDLQVYLAVLSVMSMFLSAALSERRRLYTELVEKNELERFLRSELDHRVRNNLTSLLTLIDQSVATAERADAMRRLRGRVQSMASVHTAVSSAAHAALDLQEMIEMMLPADVADRVSMSGPPIRIAAGRATALMLVLNELMSNALDHGALAHPVGTLEITWSEPLTVAPTGVLEIEWEEHHPNGPDQAAADPKAAFGLSLVRGLVKSDLAGEIDSSITATKATHRLVIRASEPTASLSAS